MSYLHYNFNDSHLLFKRLLIAVWSILTFYAFFFLYYDAFFSAAFMVVGVLLLTPLTWYLEKKKYYLFARVLFSLSCPTYVFVAMIGLGFKGQAEFYFVCATIIPFLIFDFRYIKLTGILLTYNLSLFVWSKYIPIEMIPPNIIASNSTPFHIVSTVSQFGSFTLTIVFMAILSTTFKQLREDLSYKNKELKKQNNLYLRTEKYASIGSWSFDLVNQKLAWSEQTYRIYEVDVGTKVDYALATKYFTKDDQKRIELLFHEAIKFKKSWETDFYFTTAKGNQLWVRGTGVPLTNKKGEVVRVEGTFQDITEQKKSEIAKDEFLSVISHEMRTPLMAVIGYSDLLSDTELSHEQENMIHSIQQGGQSVLTIINDVLDLSKLKSNSMKIIEKKVNLIELLEEVVAFLNHSAKVKNIEFKHHFEIENKDVLCDSTRLRQILINLLSNAIKFTSVGHVSLHVKENIIDSNNSQYIFKVEDTGCGIEPDFLPKIFTPFEQSEQNPSSRHGTGLGMTISKKLIDLMDGEIDINSKLNEGTQVFMKISFKHTKNKAKETKQILDLNFEHLKILYADDNELNQTIVAKLLESTNCHLVCVENGQKVLDCISNSECFDLILMDIQMPVLDGISATKELRKFESHNSMSETPILAFSAFSYEEDRRRALKAGCNDLISKPIRRAELLEKIFYWTTRVNA